MIERSSILVFKENFDSLFPQKGNEGEDQVTVTDDVPKIQCFCYKRALIFAENPCSKWTSLSERPVAKLMVRFCFVLDAFHQSHYLQQKAADTLTDLLDRR